MLEIRDQNHCLLGVLTNFREPPLRVGHVRVPKAMNPRIMSPSALEMMTMVPTESHCTTFHVYEFRRSFREGKAVARFPDAVPLHVSIPALLRDHDDFVPNPFIHSDVEAERARWSMPRDEVLVTTDSGANMITLVDRDNEGSAVCQVMTRDWVRDIRWTRWRAFARNDEERENDERLARARERELRDAAAALERKRAKAVEVRKRAEEKRAREAEIARSKDPLRVVRRVKLGDDE